MALDCRQIELAVLNQVVERHPDNPALADLIRQMSGDRDEEGELEEAISALREEDLLSCDGDRVRPTRSALRAHELFSL